LTTMILASHSIKTTESPYISIDSKQVATVPSSS